jgi:hypothetical protein
VGRPTRPKPVAPVVLDEVALERRWVWLYRWCSLTEWGSGVDIRETGTTAQRVEHLEAELDRLGLRAQAERFVSSYTSPPGPVVSRPAWMDRPDEGRLMFHFRHTKD